MQVSITDFINAHYDVMFRGAKANPDHFEDVEEFLLADQHDIEGYSAVNSLFINTFTDAKDAILTEGAPAMQKIKSEDVGMTAHLTTESPVYGWDLDLVKKLSPLFPGIEELEKMRAQLEVIKKELLHSLARLKDVQMRQADPKDYKDVEEIMKKLFQLAEREQLLKKTVHFDKDKIKAFISETFVERTECMIASLTKVKACSTRTFLIAGGAHLDEDTAKASEMKGDVTLPLAAFMEFIRARNLVVLSPKENRVAELGLPRDEVELIVQMHTQKLDWI